MTETKRDERERACTQLRQLEVEIRKARRRGVADSEFERQAQELRNRWQIFN